jgi:hypothetical protein
MKLEKTKNIALNKAFSDIKLKFNIDQGEIAHLPEYQADALIFIGNSCHIPETK